MLHNDADLRTDLFTRDQLGHTIKSLLTQIVTIPPRDQGEEIYRAGQLVSLTALAAAYNLDLPQLREAVHAQKQRNRKPTPYDMRL